MGLMTAARVRPAVKNSAAKITVESTQPAVRLAVLFDDMLRQPGLAADLVESVSGSASNVISLEFFNGANATILAAKSGGRYRIQGGSLSDLWLACDELVRRLREKHGEAALSFADPLPLNGLYNAIDAQHGRRLALAQAKSELNDRSHQYRLVQKRLLVRFKDRNAPPLNGLDTLLRISNDQLMATTESLAQCQEQLTVSASDLSACARMLLCLCALKHPALDDQDMRILSAHLSPHVLQMDGSKMGWKELVYLSITHMLRTVLAKTAKQSVSEAGHTATKPELWGRCFESKTPHWYDF
jgi:Bardet-Biedl syndrome 9 protein